MRSRSIWEEPCVVSVFKAYGFTCMIRHHPELGILNGYVILPKGHPLYGKSAEEIEASVEVHS